jgi:hypothetical protein
MVEYIVPGLHPLASWGQVLVPPIQLSGSMPELSKQPVDTEYGRSLVECRIIECIEELVG